MKRAADLRLVALLAVACALICAIVPDGATVVRALPAALLVLVLPGYALTAALLSPAQVTRLERVVLSIALSMVAGVITALLLNAVWHLAAAPWATGLALVTVLAALAGARRGNGQPVPRPRVPRIGVPAALCLAGAVLLTGGAAALGVTTLHAPGDTRGTTALWISPRGDNDVAVGVHSVERGRRNYELDVRVAGQRGRLIGPFALEPGEERRLLLPAPTGPIGKPIVNVVLRRLDGPRPAIRHVALRAGRRSVIFRAQPRLRPCPRAHPLRSENGCYRVVVRGKQRLRNYVSGRTVVLPEPMPEPLAVDIVVTSYDYARFLPAAIESALAQDHPRVRVIVVDDGSRDSSPQIIEGYGDRVQPILKANGGQASAFNAALAASSGDVVIFLDADDELEPYAATRVAAALAAEPGLVKVQWRMTAIDGDGRATGATLPPAGLPLPQGDQRDAELAYSFDLTWMATSGNAFPRRVLERILPMPEAPYRVNADWYLQHLTPLLGPVRSLDEPLSRRRFHGENAYGSDLAELDLEQLRTTIVTAAATRAEIGRLAGEIGLAGPPGPLLAVSDQANRLISLRLDPPRHPLPGDTRRSLVRGGLRAAGRRADASPALRAAFRAWFVAMAVAPRALAAHLATWFVFPERRPALRRQAGA